MTRKQALAFISFVIAAAFAPALRNDFIAWDDDRNFLANPAFRGLGVDNLRWMWTTFHMGHYVPLSWMSLGVDYTLWGMNPAGYHLTNILLHIATALVVFAIAERFLGDIRFSVLAALLFALNPLRVESVAWITERRDVLSAFFYASAVLCHLRTQHDQSRARPYLLTLALFACALLSKGTSVTLPALLLILDVYPLRRIGGTKGWLTATALRVYAEKIPFVALSLVMSWVSVHALPPRAQLGIADKVAVSAYSVGFYLWKTIFPIGLSPLYPIPHRIPATSAPFVAAYIAVVALSIFAWRARTRWPGATAAWVAFLVISLPMLGVVQNGPQIAADRYTYHSGPVLAILAAAGLRLVWLRAPRPTTFGATALLAAFALLTARQVTVWHDSATFWAAVLEREPNSAVAHDGVGQQLAKEGRIIDAIDQQRTAISLDPLYRESQNNLGVLLLGDGNVAEAAEHFRRAVELDPTYDEAHNNLGCALARLGDIDAAGRQFTLALAINPHMAAAHFNWANAFVKVGRLNDAVTHYEAALRIAPDPDAEHNLAVVKARLAYLAGARR